MLQCVAQRAGLKTARRVGDLPWLLVDDDDPGIFVDDFQWEWLGPMELIRRLDQPDRDDLATINAIIDVDRRPVDFNLPRPHQPLDTVRRIVPEMATKKRVDAYAAQVRSTTSSAVRGNGATNRFSHVAAKVCNSPPVERSVK